MVNFEKKNILGVGITNAKKDEVLEYIITSLRKSGKKYYIVTPNPELLVIAGKDVNYKNILNGARLALADGVGVLFAAKLLRRQIKERIQGVDLVESLCREISKQPITAAFLGAGPNVAKAASECLREKYPGLKISWFSQEWSESLRNKQIDILFVAFGSPKQEKWIYENLDELPAKVAIGVGGAFDFISGKVIRAPKFLRGLGFEWLFRLLIQPWRINRQLSLIKFVYLVIREKLNSN
jgi:N-acetylglucosaminyldiphosphoundecaprenol N-acetyl-beta-D-mannosaminyltransferase